MVVLVGIFFGYPYVKEYMSDSAQGKISNLKTQAEIAKKFAKQVISDKIANQQKENQEDTKSNATPSDDPNKKK